MDLLIQSLLFVFVLVTALQCVVWLLFPARLLWRAKDLAETPHLSVFPPVSVIVCARNEAIRLQAYLPLLLTQQYPASFEVLLADDASTDNTPELIVALQHQYPHLSTVRLSSKVQAGKKAILSTGIRTAKYDTLLLTDADCMPAGNTWMQGMVSGLASESGTVPKMVLGYAPMFNTNTWFNLWARFETMYTGLQYFSMAWQGWPFMGVGRNLLLKRELFERANGFERHLHLVSGDDDLLVNDMANRHNTSIILAPETFVYSHAKTNITAWIRQKQRHLSASIAYQPVHLLLLGGLAFSHAVHYGLAAILLLAKGSILWPVIVGGYLLRLVIVWPVYRRACRVLREPGLLPWIPVLDGCLAIWQGAVAPVLLLLGQRKIW